jgi:3-hydroxyisobutyrate dehydrogenase
MTGLGRTANDGADETVSNARVAVLGAGTMGSAMMSSLLRAGIVPVVWDRSTERTSALAARGAIVAESTGAAAHQADIVITMVTDADAVIAIADKDGMLDAMHSGAIWAQMSTIGVDGFDRIAALASDRRPDVLLVDAPVSGSRVPAEEGALTIFASGPDEARGRLQPVFDALGHRTLWLGAAGLGSRLKLVNNVLLAFTAHGLGEAVSIAHDLGLPTQTVIDAVGGGALSSPWLSGKLRRLARDDYSAEFSLALALKDVTLAAGAVNASKHPVLGSLATQWRAAADAGLGSYDLTAIARFLESD